jgi:hypothetical protein
LFFYELPINNNMAKKQDLKALGEVYGNLGKETAVVAESTEALTVGDKSAEVGEAELKDGGPTEEGGFEEAETDVTKVGENENPYNVKGVSYGDDNAPALDTDQPEPVLASVLDDEEDEEEEDEEKDVEETEESEEVPEEDEESPSKELEIAQEGLNKYMAKKSIFDELYAKVISEDFGMEEVDDLDALGIDDATPDSELADDDAEEGGDEITVTLDKEVAKTLCDLLQAAMGDYEGDDAEDGDEDVTDELAAEPDLEEDNEGAPKAHTTHVDMGEHNKVGHADGLGGQAAGHADGGKSADQSKLGGTVNDGKHNKVGTVKQGPAFGDLKVTPKNKEVKAG